MSQKNLQGWGTKFINQTIMGKKTVKCWFSVEWSSGEEGFVVQGKVRLMKSELATNENFKWDCFVIVTFTASIYVALWIYRILSVTGKKKDIWK